MLNSFYLGIDQHASQLTINLRDQNGDVFLRKQVSTHPEKVTQFFEDLTRRCIQSRCRFWAIVEVCGFGDWLIEMLKNFQCQRIVVVQPEENGKRKTDRRDAAKLSEELWLYRERIENGKPINKLKIISLPDSIESQLRRLTTLRKHARAKQIRAINQVKFILRRHNLQHDIPTKTFPTIAAMKWLESLKLPAADRLEMNHALEDFRLHERRVAELDQMIAELSKEDDDTRILRTTPGFAQFSSVALSCRISGIERFKRPRALSNYFGLTPGCRNSGEKKDRLGHITKAGSGMARWILGQASKHILRIDPLMRNWFKKLKRKRGAKIARVAVMRRMATVLWHMLTKRKTWAEVRSLGIGLQE